MIKQQDSRFIVLGSGSGFPQANRATSGYALEVAGELSLIDCGGGVTFSFLKCGLDPLSVERIFISHTHPDHVCELPLFLQLIYLSGGQNKVEIYLPAEFVELFQQYLCSVYMIPEKFPFELCLIGYEGEYKYQEDFTLRTFPTNHLSGYREHIERLSLPNRMQSHSFQIVVAGKALFYSSDIAGWDDIKSRLPGQDIVLMELTHVNLDVFFAEAPVLNVGQFVITHLGDARQQADIVSRSKKAGLTNLALAEDGMIIEL